jgi:hypothetical protein
MAAKHALRPAILSVLLIFAWLVSGCSASAPAQAPAPTTPEPSQSAGAPPPPETVDIRGRVVQARRNVMGEPPVGTIRVEGTLEPGTRYDKATILADHKTKVFLGRDGKRASFSFIHSGDLVEVTFVGPPAKTTTGPDPIKATAARIVILEHTL